MEEQVNYCPKCQELLPDHPELWNVLKPVQVMNALSRRDNKTYICSPCGEIEAISDYSHESESSLMRRYHDLPNITVTDGDHGS